MSQALIAGVEMPEDSHTARLRQWRDRQIDEEINWLRGFLSVCREHGFERLISTNGPRKHRRDSVVEYLSSLSPDFSLGDTVQNIAFNLGASYAQTHAALRYHDAFLKRPDGKWYLRVERRVAA